MKFKIIFEDEQILVVNKPTGLVVNRSETNRQETLQDQLVDYLGLGKSGFGSSATPELAHDCDGERGIGDRAGIVHRLDRETSGVLVVAKTQKAFDFLQKQFKERKVKKEYVALVHGRVKDQTGSVVGDIGRIGRFGKFGVVGQGRESRTDYEVQKYFSFGKEKIEAFIYSSSANNNLFFSKSRINYLKRHALSYTLVHLFPKTGRTHQVRVHLKSIGCSVVSDPLYTPAKLLKFDRQWCPRLFLHAQKIEFENLKRQRVVFESELPYDLIKALNFLKVLPDD